MLQAGLSGHILRLIDQLVQCSLTRVRRVQRQQGDDDLHAQRHIPLVGYTAFPDKDLSLHSCEAAVKI